MTGFSHTAILASAGSGKTWQLSTRYLRLLALGAPPARILASTFTRAAAGEIRDRILSRLAEAADDEEKCRELAEAISMPALTRARATAVLAGLVRELDGLQIRTLDSFFASVVRCFSLELGLPRDATIVEGEAATALRREAIRIMLDEADHDRLVELLRLLIEGRSDRNVTGAIEQVVAALHEVYREAPAEAWEAIEFWPLADAAAIAAAIEGIERGAAGLSDSRHRKAAERDIGCARRCGHDAGDDWAEFISSGLARIVAEEGALQYHRKPIALDLLPHYRALIHHARAAMRNMLASRTRAMRGLLEMYDRAYERARATRGAMTFADLTAAVTSERFAQRPDLLDELYYRLDGRIDHLLFDEMQDTSVQQWRALRPMVEEIIATRPGERTFFCVGDVKQSIYGWREACPELLESLCGIYPAILQETLAKSRRSAQPVIDAVNRAFSGVRGNPAVADFANAGEAWDANWRAHETTHDELAGYVEIRAVKRATDGTAAEKEQKQEEMRLSEAADLAALLHRCAPHLSIGVLTRTNKAAARMLYELGPARRNLPATGRGGGLLTDAPPVNAILDALRLADHPGHSIAAFNVMHSPLGEHLELLDSGDGRENQQQASRVARRIRAMVQERGFAAVIEEWTSAIAESVDARQLRRLHELIDAADLFDRQRGRPGTRCDEFVRTASAMVAADPAPAPIEVMTIHKSKGLEFDAVILPDLEGAVADMSQVNFVAEREGPGGAIRGICAGRTRRAIWEQFDDLRPMFEAHCNRLARESLCLLYVAMTRAKQGLYLLIDPADRLKDGGLSRTTPTSHAGILVCALGSGPPDAEELVFAHGDADWHERDRPEKVQLATPKENEEVAIPIRLAPSTRARPAATRGPSAEAAKGQERTLADILRPHPVEAFDRGLALHALFELVEWLDDGAPSKEACVEAVARALPRRDRAWAEKMSDSFATALGHETVRTILSRKERAGENARVWRELRFARLHEGAVEQGAIDRLVAWYGDENDSPRCTRAMVIDFKTDDVGALDCAARASTYEPQIAAYRSAAAEFLRIDAGCVEASLVFVNAGAVIEMEAAL